MTTKRTRYSKSVWVFPMLLLTATRAWAEDDIPPIHEPLYWTERVLSFLRDLWQLLMGYVA